MEEDNKSEEILQECESREEEIQALLSASRAVLEQKDFATTARIIFDQARLITGAQSGYIALLSDDGMENEILFLESGGLPCSVDPELPMPIRGLRSEAYRSGRTVCDNDFMNSEWIKYMPRGHVTLKNVMFAPLIIEDKVEGIMGLANKPSDFSQRDMKMASAFGEFAAIALRNAQNIDKLNVTIQNLELALSEVKTLRGIIPICSVCKRVRNDSGVWEEVEVYVSKRSDSDFSHGFCVECAKSFFGEDFDKS